MADITKVKLPNNVTYNIKDENALHVGDTINAATVNGHTVQTNVPSGAVFTDTTYTPASATPLMDGVAAVGTSVKYAREDHKHPTDSRIDTKVVISKTQPTNQQTGDLWLVLAEAPSYTAAEGRSF